LHDLLSSALYLLTRDDVKEIPYRKGCWSRLVLWSRDKARRNVQTDGLAIRKEDPLSMDKLPSSGLDEAVLLKNACLAADRPDGKLG
jgi:hypothetical protein